MSNIWRLCGKSFWVACLVLGTAACEVRATTGKFCETSDCEDGFAATSLAEDLPTFSGLTLAPYVPVVIEETNDSAESDLESGSDLEGGEGDESGEHTNQDSMDAANQQGNDSSVTAPESSDDDVDSDLDEAEGDVSGHDDTMADLPGDGNSSGLEDDLEDEIPVDELTDDEEVAVESDDVEAAGDSANVSDIHPGALEGSEDESDNATSSDGPQTDHGIERRRRSSD